MSDVERPVPVPDATSAEFWSAAAEHRLVVQLCCNCGRFAHPPVVICPECLSPDAGFDFQRLSGEGVLRTWTIMRAAFLPGFQRDIPWAIGEAEMYGAEGVRLLARLADGAEAPYRIGAPVETIFDDIRPGLSLPVLRLVRS